MLRSVDQAKVVHAIPSFAHAPPLTAEQDWKEAASHRIRQAEIYLIRGQQTTRRSESPIAMHQSVRCPQWLEAVEYVAKRWTASGVLHTLVPKFYDVDPEHRLYEHYKYPKDHPMHRSNR